MYDTIIIGAGLSGLAAGIRLAYYDKKVLILEKHTTIGGLNSFYRLRGRNYDVGLHAVTNYAPPGTKKGPLSKLLRQLRLNWDDFDLKPQLESAVVFPGRKLRFNNDFNLLREEIRKVFPKQIDQFDLLNQAVINFDELDLSQKTISARSVLNEMINDPVLIDMLLCPLMFYGSAREHDMDFNQFVIMYKAIFHEGFSRPFEGVRPIMKAITRKYKSLGGELRLRTGVCEILSENGHAVGVKLDDSEVLYAKNILSSIGSVETFNLCPQIPALEKSAVKAGKVSFCETIYTLNKLPSELGHRETIIFYNAKENFTYAPPDEPCDLSSSIICSPNNFDYGLNENAQSLKANEGVMRITALANPDYWFALTPEAYYAAKQYWEEKIYDAALPCMPEFREHILDTDMFTPKTIKRFTGHQRGCVYGAEDKILPGTTPLKNLYICGTDQGFLGIIGSMLSGITMANNHCLM